MKTTWNRKNAMHADVVGVPGLQEEPVQTDDAGVAVTEDRVQRPEAAEIADRGHAAELEREPDRVVRQQRDHERRQVHHHHVPGVLRSREAGHEEREPDLHEQHEEAGDEQPGEVDRDPEVPGLVGQRLMPACDSGTFVSAGRRRGSPTRSRSWSPPGSAWWLELTDGDQRDQRDQRQQEDLLASRHPWLPSPERLAGARLRAPWANVRKGRERRVSARSTQRLRKPHDYLS